MPEENSTGYWEGSKIVELHDKLLEAFGSIWSDFTAISGDKFESAVCHYYEGELIAKLNEEFSKEDRLILVKDPRISRIVPLWKRVMTAYGVTPLFVMPYRNPLEVAASLVKRGRDTNREVSIENGLLIWLRHALEFEFETRGFRRSFVHYNDLLADWRESVKKIGVDLGVSWPRLTYESAHEVDAFLNRELRHHVFTDRDLAVDGRVGQWVRKCYQALQASQSDDSHMRNGLDRIRDEFNRAEHAFAPIIVGLSVQVKTSQEERAQHVARVAHEVAWRDDRISTLDHGLAQVQDQNVQERLRHHQDLAERGLQISALEQDLNQARDRIHDVSRQLDQEMAWRDQQLVAIDENLRQVQDRLCEERLRYDHDIAERDGQIVSLGQTAEQAQTALRRHHQQELDQKRQHFGQELDRRDAQIAALEQALERQERERVEQADQARCSEEALAHRLDVTTAQARALLESDAYRVGRALVRLVRVLLFPLRLIRGLIRRFMIGRAPNWLAGWWLRPWVRLIEESGYFDGAAYLRRYPDVAAAHVAPALHYLRFGRQENRTPGAAFDAHDYLSRYADVAAGGINPLLHYLLHGRLEGRYPRAVVAPTPRPVPSVQVPDLTPAGQDRDHRDRSEVGPGTLALDQAAVLSSRLEQTEAALAALAGAITSFYGQLPPVRRFLGVVRAALRGKLRQRLAEDRDIATIVRAGLFDHRHYLSRYSDVAATRVDPIVHYVRHGAREGRAPHPGFDTQFYWSAYPDVLRSGINPLAHYARFGAAEGRMPNRQAAGGHPRGDLNPLLADRLFGGGQGVRFQVVTAGPPLGVRAVSR